MARIGKRERQRDRDRDREREAETETETESRLWRPLSLGRCLVGGQIDGACDRRRRPSKMASASSHSTAAAVVFHGATFAVYGAALYYDSFHLRMTHSGRQSYAGRFKYLTFWNELIQTAFFAFSFITDFVISNNWVKEKDRMELERPVLQRFRDMIFASIVFPVGAFVVITFWTIYSVDRELIFPKALDEVVPQWLNHVWHTSVVFFLLIEKCVVCHHYPSRWRGLTYTAAFCCTYLLWVFWIAFYADIWVYPILAVMDWPMRITFCVVCAAFLVFLYTVGEFITKTIWGSRVLVVKKAVD